MKISTPFISFALKIVGAVMLIASLIDYLFLLIPLEWQNQNWQITTTNSLVDRGIVPLLAIILIMMGWWISDNASNTLGKPIPAIRLSVFILSSLLGLFFLLLVPLHLSNVNRASSNVMQQIDQRAGQQEEQIQNFTAQLDAIAKDPQQLSQQIAQRNKVIDSGQFQGRQLNAREIEQIASQRNQLQQLLDLAKDPAQLNAKLDELKTRLETQLRDIQEQQKKKAGTIALKQSFRTGINSFMLSVGYIALGWLGIKSMGGQAKTSPRKA